MASRAELLQICDELEIEHDKMTIEEMKTAIRELADKKFAYKKYPIGKEDMSYALIKFLTQEYDFILKREDGTEIDYKEVI